MTYDHSLRLTRGSVQTIRKKVEFHHPIGDGSAVVTIDEQLERLPSVD
jgi:hypothetical protein